MGQVNPNPVGPAEAPKTNWSRAVSPKERQQNRVSKIGTSHISSQPIASPQPINKAVQTENTRVDTVGKKGIIIGTTRSVMFVQVLEAMEKDEKVTFQDVRNLIDKANEEGGKNFDKVIKEAFVTYVQAPQAKKKEESKEIEVKSTDRLTSKEKARTADAKKSTAESFINAEVRRNVESQTIDKARENQKRHERKMAERDDEIRERNKKASDENVKKNERKN